MQVNYWDVPTPWVLRHDGSWMRNKLNFNWSLDNPWSEFCPWDAQVNHPTKSYVSTEFRGAHHNDSRSIEVREVTAMVLPLGFT